MAGWDNDVSFAQEGLDIGAHPNTLGYLASIEFDKPGEEVNLVVNNTSSTNQSNALIEARVDASSAGIPFIRFTNGTDRSYAMGMNVAGGGGDPDRAFRLIKATNGDAHIDNANQTTNKIVFDVNEFGGSDRFNVRIARMGIGNNGIATPSSLNINSGSTANQNSSINIQVTNGGQPFISYTGTGVGAWTHGATSNATQLFRLGVGNDPASLSVIAQQITPAGEVTFPNTPAFAARLSTTPGNVTGDGTVYTVIYDTELFDQNSDYNNATGVFTAPVTGRYQINASCALSAIGAGHTAGYMALNTTAREYRINASVNVAASATPTNNFGFQGSTLADMDAGDTATITIQVANSTKTITAAGNATIENTFFTGKLVA